MTEFKVGTERLLLRPLPPEAAAALLDGDREAAATVAGALFSPDWPNPDLFGVLPAQGTLPPDEIHWGIWLMIEHATSTVVGSLGFIGRPDLGGLVEIGYDVVPDRRRRGYLVEAASALIDWALAQPEVNAVTARCETDNTASIRSLRRLGFAQVARAGGRFHWRLPPPAP